MPTTQRRIKFGVVDNVKCSRKIEHQKIDTTVFVQFRHNIVMYRQKSGFCGMSGSVCRLQIADCPAPPYRGDMLIYFLLDISK
jgi:hypothetical protein